MTMPEKQHWSTGLSEEERYQLVQQQQGLPLEQSRSLLMAALGDDCWRVRKQAVELLLAARPDQSDLHLLVELLRDEDNAGLRNTTAELMVRTGQQAVAVLLAYLHDDDHDLRKLVVDALAAIGGTEAGNGLIAALGDSDSNVAAAAAEGLGQVGGEAAEQALLQHLGQNREQFFRFNALASLGRIGSPGPLPMVVRHLSDQEMLRKPVYEALGQIGGDLEAVELLLQGATSHLPSVRRAAVYSLARVIQRFDDELLEEARKKLNNTVQHGLVGHVAACYNNADSQQGEAVLYLLGLIADPGQLQLLFSALADERMAHFAEQALQGFGDHALLAARDSFRSIELPEERIALCRFAGRSGLAGAVELVGLGLVDHEPGVRAAAALSAARLHNPELLGLVANLLNDADHEVQETALAALRHYADLDPRLVGSIAERLVESGDRSHRYGAATLFAALKDFDQLGRLLKDEDATVREAAVRASGRLFTAGSCASLMITLSDEDPDVRIAAAEALAECSCAAAVTPLRLSLQDQDPWVQAAALQSLVRLIGKNSLPDLLECWDKGAEVVQLACLEAIERINSPEALQIISNNLGHRDGEVLKRAIELIQFKQPELLQPWLQHCLFHRDWDIRLTTVRACGALPVEEQWMFLQQALQHEDNDLVRAEINQILGSG